MCRKASFNKTKSGPGWQSYLIWCGNFKPSWHFYFISWSKKRLHSILFWRTNSYFIYSRLTENFRQDITYSFPGRLDDFEKILFFNFSKVSVWHNQRPVQIIQSFWLVQTLTLERVSVPWFWSIWEMKNQYLHKIIKSTWKWGS